MADEKHGKKKRAKKKVEPSEQPGGLSESAPDAAVEESADDVEGLKARARERDEFLDLLQRARAEFSNYRKRIERDRIDWTERSVAVFVAGLLPALDDFDRALAHADEAPDLDSFVRGVRLIEGKVYDVLKSSGVEPFEPEKGEPFNPAEHEAITVEVTDEFPDRSVSEVLLKGYRLRDRILRAAQVRVVRNVPVEPNEAPGDEAAETPAEDGKPHRSGGGEEGVSDADV